MWTELIGFRQGTCAVSCDRDKEPSGHMKGGELSLVEQLVDSEEGLCCSMVFVKTCDA
jgi:hypothetical protein